MARTNNKLKAFVRFDGTGRIIPGSLILNRFKPAVGNWQETPAYECCNPSPAPLGLRLLFSNITEVNAIVGDSSNVSDWNTYFDLPAYGAPFTSVSVTGDEVKLYGGSSIIIKQQLFDQPDELGTYLLEVDDDAGSIIELEYDAFGADNNSGCPNLVSANFPNLIILGEAAFVGYNGSSLTTVNMPQVTTADIDCFWDCVSLTTINLPLLTTASSGLFHNCSSLITISLPQLTTIGNSFFLQCTSLTSISIPSCTNLGGTVGDNGVFYDIVGNTISLTIPSALMTCNGGLPDGDIQYLQANNIVTIITT